MTGPAVFAERDQKADRPQAFNSINFRNTGQPRGEGEFPYAATTDPGSSIESKQNQIAVLNRIILPLRADGAGLSGFL